ncbi:MAG: FKBP-type peptidyl-prolyl cis-trans isomerase [Chitinophagaceae bacterium]|nr:FKBP-type peptidyl-prolyl cis-trans isomerase [Chitinophagaceae bacterium]MCW5905630.1 FKBP-type peptidyl-prolyl cis-trans isomerase [Chitinophagaceae bacterium]
MAMAQTTKPKPKSPVAKANPQVVAKPTNALTTGLDSLSYALGTRIALNLAANNIDTLSYNAFVAGIKDVLKKSNLKFDDNTCNNIINTKLQELANMKATKEKAASEKFLTENKKKPGITVTPSGLQYEVITMGTGIKPTLQDTVVCHYRGTLINGLEFDNSYSRGEPITFPVTGVIKGWTEALQLMPQGSKWKLYIPSELGYGDRGAGNDIPGGAALIFEVELVGVKTAAH